MNGRIHSFFMYPMNFEEFLIAANLSRYANLIKNSSPQKAIDTVFHKEILEQLKIFILIGGMPEAVMLKLIISYRFLIKSIL